MIQNDYLIDIKVITMDDNLEHNYFSYIAWNNDNSYPIGNASLVTFFDNNTIKYWKRYKGIVVISAEMINDTKINTNSSNYQNIITEHYKKKIKNQQLLNKLKKQELKKENKKKHHTEDEVSKIPKNNRIINNEYNFSFIGTVRKPHQRGRELIIELEDIGWKFSQYVPKEFRNKYIANQKLGDAFQAICEFMGVDFAYSIDELNQYTFGADGYSIQKDGKTIERNPTIEEEFEKETNKEETKKEDKINQFQEEFETKIRDLFIGNTYYESDLTTNLLNYNQITIQPSASTSSQISEVDDKKEEESDNDDNNNQNNNDNNDNNKQQN